MSGQEATARRRELYHRGLTTTFACHADPRFNFSLYVPEDYEAGAPLRLLVAVHGTLRQRTLYRQTFAEFGRYTGTAVLAPLFPVGVLGDDNADGYKYMREGDLRYDHVLLQMIEQVEGMLGCRFPPAMMFGFSGGGHFTHRFTLLHPDKLSAVSIGSPGSVTRIDDDRDWWVGTRDVEKLFGAPVDLAALRRVRVHLVVGGADAEQWEITHSPGSRYWMEGANDAGATRIERNTALCENLRAHGVDVRQDIVPGVSHSMTSVAPYTIRFFREFIAQSDPEASQ